MALKIPISHTQDIRFVTSLDGTRIAYARSGSGPPLVRAGRWIGHLELDWANILQAPFLQEVGRSYTFYRYDMRGCGLSDHDAVDLSLDAQVCDLEAVADAVGLERFPLLGVSAGAAIALAYTARHPERVSHLLLYAPMARGALKRNPTQKQIEEAQVMLKLIELGWGRDNPAFRQTHTSQFMPDASLEQMHAWNDLQRITTSPDCAARMAASIYDWDVTESLPRVACPTVVMHSRDDARVSFSEGRHIAALIPDARLVPLEGRNHVLIEGTPVWKVFFTELRAFVPPGHIHTDPPFEGLTNRQVEVLHFVANGLDNAQIAARLGLAEKTVRNTVTRIYDKIGVENRSQAIVRARDAGFGTTHH